MRSAINRSQIGESSQRADEELGTEVADGTDEFGETNPGEGFITDETAPEMDADWSDIANGVLNLAADIEMIFDTNGGFNMSM